MKAFYTAIGHPVPAELIICECDDLKFNSTFVKIATYNVNGINGRLPVLLRWLNESQPDIACLQELKAPDEKFPWQALLDAGYNAVWHGQKAWNGVAILAKTGYHVEDIVKGLPGDATDIQSRYIQATINGIVIACIYLPNGNPAPGPKFDYKMAWFTREDDLGL
jgi:exodeoxyribonuclease III